MAKKPKRYRKINLFETSVVGIGAYPDAHLSLDEESFSLIKALGLADVPGTGAYKEDELNLENEVMEEEVETTPEATETPVEETTEEPTDAPEAETPAEEPAEAPAEEAAEPEEAEKSANVQMAKAITLLANELKKSRGLVDDEEPEEVALKKKLDGMSLGELACMTKDGLGRPLFSNF